MLCVGCLTRPAADGTSLCPDCLSRLNSSKRRMFYEKVRRAYEIIDSWTTAKDLARDLGCGVDSARKILRLLAEVGLAEVGYRLKNGKVVRCYRRSRLLSVLHGRASSSSS